MRYDADQILVDGYSVIHAWPTLRAALAQSLERARDRLVAAMTALQDATAVPVTVVFDARSKSGPTASMEAGGVRIVFTRKGMTADAFIERQVAQARTPDRILVVTNDGAETFTARAFGAHVITVEELRSWVEEERGEVRQTAARIRRSSGGKFRTV
jgi:predicted RNA-binding protein with PIN domain